LTFGESVAALEHDTKARSIGEALRSCHGGGEHGYGEDLGVHCECSLLVDCN